MDRFIQHYDAIDDNDLMLCNGIGYQKDMSHLVSYNEDYFNKCLSYEDREIALKINRGRIGLVNHYFDGPVLDIGVGSGEFIKKRPKTYGYDINPVAVEWLKEHGRFSNRFEDFMCFTFWDVIEHVPDPGKYFDRIPRWAYVFTSIPVFEDLTKIRKSKHYRPNEHLYYFTKNGLINWMQHYGFLFLQMQDFEIDAGREDIYTFAFRKV